MVGTGGHSLTVVQAQRLALARLVLADPPVAILDEVARLGWANPQRRRGRISADGLPSVVLSTSGP